MDLEKVLLDAIQQTLSGGLIEQSVKQTIERVVTTTVRECVERNLSSYGPFGKQVEGAIKNAVAIHGEIDLPSYNDIILKIIAAQVQHACEQSIEKQVADRIKDLLTPAPETITLTDLVIEFIEHAKREYRAGCVCHGDTEKISLCYQKDTNSSHFYSIGLDRNSGKNIGECEIYFGCTQDGKIYYLRFRNQDVERKMFVGPIYGFERMIFQMKAAGTKLVIDQDPEDIDLEYSLEDEE